MEFRLWLEAVETSVSRLAKLALSHGWKYEPVRLGQDTNPNSLTVGSVVYPTLVSPEGVKIALDVVDIYKFKSRILKADPTEVTPDRVTLAAIITPGENRKQGLGSAALQALQSFAEELGIVIVGEPVQMKQFKDKKSLTTQQLVAWYKRHGWVQRTESDDSILEYRPNKANKANK